MARKRSLEPRTQKRPATKKRRKLSAYEIQRQQEFEQREEQIDLQDARAALAEARINGTIPWEKIKQELNL